MLWRWKDIPGLEYEKSDGFCQGDPTPSKKRKDLGPPIGKKSDSPYLGFLAGSYENIEMLYILSGSAISGIFLNGKKTGLL